MAFEDSTVQMDYLLSFATAVAAPENLGGLAVAARHTLQWIEDAQQLFPSPRLAATRAEIKKQQQLLEGRLEETPCIGLITARERKLAAYRLFVDPLPLTGPAESIRRLTALAGMAVAVAISRNEAVDPHYADSILKVCKAYMGGRRLHEDWYLAAEGISQGETNLRPIADRCTSPDVKRFLLATLDLYESTLKPGVAASADGNDRGGDANRDEEENDSEDPAGDTHTQLALDGREPKDAANRERLDEEVGELASDSEPLDLLRWQLGRAEFARFGDTMGLSSVYGRLPPECLSPITTGIGAALRNALFEHEYALFAIYSLVFNLPPERLTDVPIGAQGDVRLDPRGYVRWEMSSAFAADAHPMYVPIPLVAFERQRQLLTDRPSVKTVGELCLVPAVGGARDEWLRGYDKFLKSYGDSAYPPWPSRFAYSLGQV